MMGKIHVDPTELRAAATRIRLVGPGLVPLGPRTPRGVGVYGFPLLTTAIERFLESMDADLRTAADLLARQVDGLGDTARDFESFESDSQSELSTLLGTV